MTDTNDLTDDRLMALLANLAYHDRRYADTGRPHDPEDFASLLATPGRDDCAPRPAAVERAIDLLPEYAVDTSTLRQGGQVADYDGPALPFAVDYRGRYTLALDHQPGNDRRVRAFFAAHAPDLAPEGL